MVPATLPNLNGLSNRRLPDECKFKEQTRSRPSPRIEIGLPAQADIATGLADMAAGRVKDFDIASIVERGRKLLADRSPCRLTKAAEAHLKVCAQ